MTAIPGTENVTVQGFELVPSATSVSMVVQGAGRGAALLINFDHRMLFQLVGKVLGTAYRIDGAQVVAVLRQLAPSLGMQLSPLDANPPTAARPEGQPASASSVATPPPSEATPGQASVPLDLSGMIEFTVEFQATCRQAELSDSVTAVLLQAALGLASSGGRAASSVAGVLQAPTSERSGG